jgi:plasmid maintenance system antidote protein VapI
MAEKKYGDIVREKMKTKDNAQGHPITIRMMERDLGFTYEHIRKVVKNQPVVSRELNDKLCIYLGLEANKMWSIMEREKTRRRFENAAVTFAVPPDPRFRDLWPKLTPHDLDRLLKIAEGMATANEETGLVTARRAR